MADLSKCYLQNLGDSERGKLSELRGQLPQLIQRAKEQSEEAKAMKTLSIWGVELEKETEASDIVPDHDFLMILRNIL